MCSRVITKVALCVGVKEEHVLLQKLKRYPLHATMKCF